MSNFLISHETSTNSCAIYFPDFFSRLALSLDLNALFHIQKRNIETFTIDYMSRGHVRPRTKERKKEKKRKKERKRPESQLEFSRIIWLMAYSTLEFPAYSIMVLASFAIPWIDEGQSWLYRMRKKRKGIKTLYNIHELTKNINIRPVIIRSKIYFYHSMS